MNATGMQIPDFPMQRTCPWLPPPQYAELRQDPPRRVRLPSGAFAWLITRHADVKLALGDHRLSAAHTNPGYPLRIQVPATPRGQSFLRMDDPEHGRLRRMVLPQFTARAARAMRPTVERMVGQLLDELEQGPRPVDLVAAFTQPLPCMAVGSILGVADADQRVFAGMTRAILSQDTGPAEVYQAALDMGAYLERLIAEKQRDPGDDLLSALATQHVATGELTRDDLVAMARLILVAGYETTAKQLGLSVFALLRHPDHLAELRRSPALIKPAVQELLRYWSVSEDNMGRVALADLEIGGAQIAKGDGVMVAVPSANHDERVFPDPGRLDFHRDASAHLAFGSGPHHCPGAPLAAQELELALSLLITRFPALRLAVDAGDLDFRFPQLVYGVTALPVTW
jgi:cytochrome P450